MMRTIDMVREFHEAFELHEQIADSPIIPSPEVCLMRIQALIEETGELAHALGKGDLKGVLDGLTDLQYFLDGTYIACGMTDLKAPAMREVHRSNMTKLGPDGRPIIDESGRVVKGPNYEPPRLDLLI